MTILIQLISAFFSMNIFLDIKVIKQQFWGNQLNGSTDLDDIKHTGNHDVAVT